MRQILFYSQETMTNDYGHCALLWTLSCTALQVCDVERLVHLRCWVWVLNNASHMYSQTFKNVIFKYSSLWQIITDSCIIAMCIIKYNTVKWKYIIVVLFTTWYHLFHHPIHYPQPCHSCPDIQQCIRPTKSWLTNDIDLMVF